MPLKNNTRFCGARCKRDTSKSCMQPSMKNGRCKLHGGKSTGPKTPDGKLRSAQANFKHGFYSKEEIEERRFIREMMKWRDDLE